MKFIKFSSEWILNSHFLKYRNMKKHNVFESSRFLIVLPRTTNCQLQHWKWFFPRLICASTYVLKYKHTLKISLFFNQHSQGSSSCAAHNFASLILFEHDFLKYSIMVLKSMIPLFQINHQIFSVCQRLRNGVPYT